MKREKRWVRAARLADPDEEEEEEYNPMDYLWFTKFETVRF
jgi:hypothetical protein